jgi:hypothetical protein
MPDQEENPKPNFDPRPPGQRRRAGESEDDSEKRRGRRNRSGEDNSERRRIGIMSRISGRSELDKARTARYEPYTYESNGSQLKWVVLALAAWIVVSLILAMHDRATSSYLTELRDQGIQSIPPSLQSSLIDFQQIIDFAEKEGFACDPEADLSSPGCIRLLEVQEEYVSLRNTGNLLFLGLMAVLVVNMFAFGALTHRASRNLPTLKSEKQGFAPERAVIWFFVPVFNLFKPWMVFREMFKASDPDVSTTDDTAWKTKGSVPTSVHAWAGIFIAVFIFNPRTIGWFWYPVRETIEDELLAQSRLIMADILLALLGAAAILVVADLHRRQEARHAKVGKVIVTPAPPVDSLEEALKEGIRRKELENKRARGNRDDETKGS